MEKTMFVAVVFTGNGRPIKTFTGENDGEASGPANRRFIEENRKWVEAAPEKRTEAPPFWDLYSVYHRATPNTPPPPSDYTPVKPTA